MLHESALHRMQRVAVGEALHGANFLPSACTANIRHERTGAPSTITVQAPQIPCSQPICVPVWPQSSRIASASVRRGSTHGWARPLMFKVTSARSVMCPVLPCERNAAPDALRRCRDFVDRDTKGRQRVIDGVENGGRCADGAAFADTFGPRHRFSDSAVSRCRISIGGISRLVGGRKSASVAVRILPVSS